MTKIETA